MEQEQNENSEFSLEEKLKEIRALLQKMQAGNQDFDANIKLFTQGTELIEACREYLDTAEMSIKKLIDTEEGPREIEME